MKNFGSTWSTFLYRSHTSDWYLHIKRTPSKYVVLKYCHDIYKYNLLSLYERAMHLKYQGDITSMVCPKYKYSSKSVKRNFRKFKSNFISSSANIGEYGWGMHLYSFLFGTSLEMEMFFWMSLLFWWCFLAAFCPSDMLTAVAGLMQGEILDAIEWGESVKVIRNQLLSLNFRLEGCCRSRRNCRTEIVISKLISWFQASILSH